MIDIESLVQKLIKYSNSYYKGHQVISDAEYDALEDQLRQLDPNNAYFKKNRESTATGYGVQYPHKYSFIGSVDKIHSLSESKLLKKATKLSLSAKLDGTSMVAYYTNGFLDYALTRCDGYKGFDVTQHYLKITKKYKLNIPYDFTGAIRGEVVFTKANWEIFHQKHPEAKFARNSGTGLVNGKDVSEDEELLSFVAYDFPGSNYKISDCSIFASLTLFGFETAPHATFTKSENISLDEDELKDLFNQWSKKYPLDGIVLRRIDNVRSDDELKDGIYIIDKEQEAFKFEAETKECKVIDITWQLGRTGKLTPVIQIEPTELSGAVVCNVTGHNAKNILDNKIGPGAIIKVRRSGEVIPYLVGVVKQADIIGVPDLCPICGETVSWTDTLTDVVCKNEECDGLVFKNISNYILCLCDDIKGVGDVFLDSFITYLDPKSIADLLDILHTNTFEVIPVLGNADNLVAKKVIRRLIETDVDATKFFKGIGIKFLGASFAQELANSPYLGSLLQAIKENNKELTQKILFEILPGRQAVIGSIISKINKISEILKVMNNYDQFIKTPDLERISHGEMHLYAVTGSVSKPRKEFEKELLDKGWQLTDNISKCELLINNDTTSNSSKNLKAKAANKPIVSEEEFRKNYLK